MLLLCQNSRLHKCSFHLILKLMVLFFIGIAFHKLELALLRCFHFWLKGNFCDTSFAFVDFMGELSLVDGLQLAFCRPLVYGWRMCPFVVTLLIYLKKKEKTKKQKRDKKKKKRKRMLADTAFEKSILHIVSVDSVQW